MRAMQRVPMADFEPALKKKLDALWGAPPNLYRALANHPRIIDAWSEFARTLRHDSRTPRPLRELMILRGAQMMRSDYEWAQHLAMARKSGVREEQIAALAGWRASAQFDAREKAALGLAEAVTAGSVADEVYAEAARHFDSPDLVELCVTAGFYAMVGRVLDALRVELEPEFVAHSPKLPRS